MDNRLGQLCLGCRLWEVALGSRLWASRSWVSAFQIRGPVRYSLVAPCQLVYATLLHKAGITGDVMRISGATNRLAKGAGTNKFVC